jgi:predicted RecA/RadA family phage recombinase
MTQAQFIHDGYSIDHTPAANVAAGAVVEVGNRVLVSKRDIPAGTLGALATRGIFDVVKISGAISAGDGLYWDNDGNPVSGTAGSGAATKTPANGKFMGYAIADAGASDTTVRVLLRSMEDANAETLGLGDLTDVGPVAYTAGRILVADGDSYEDVALTGPFNLSGAGLLSLDSATVAATGSAQGDAAAIADGFTLVSAADGTKGVKLPAAAAGGLCIVKNADAANAILKVYPDTGDAINALGANAALSMAAKTSAVFVAFDATTWYTIPLLPS